MPHSAGTFTLTINTVQTFGDSTNSEGIEISYMLRQVAQDVASGRPSHAIIDRMGNNVGSYSFGAGMLGAGR